VSSPGAADEDVLEQAVKHALFFMDEKISTPDWRVYHSHGGNVHCGTAEGRESFEFKWWGRLG